MKAPILETDRLRLEPLGEALLTKTYVGWLNDPEVVRYSEQRHHRHTLESCRAFVAGFDRGPDCLWAIREKAPAADGSPLRHIGNISIEVDEPNRVADIRILIGEKDAWGKGLGAEAWIAVMDHLFGERGMRKITAGTMAENLGMLKIMEKAGMREDGRRRGQCLLDGRPVDMVYTARFAD